jgi:hypothetical protein
MRQRMRTQVAVAHWRLQAMYWCSRNCFFGPLTASAGGGTRTRTRFPAMDFESISAANFDTPAQEGIVEGASLVSPSGSPRAGR